MSGSGARNVSCRVNGRISRPDVQLFLEQEQAALHSLQALLPLHRTRPSLLLAAARLTGSALGLACAVAPLHTRLAVAGAVGEALSEAADDGLRELRAAGAAEQVGD